MSIFKYFTKEAHALELIKKGVLMMQPLSHFRGREADGVRGDPLDGILTYAPENGLVMNMEDGRVLTLEGGSFNSSVSHNDIFVYCASNQLSTELAKMFGAFCVEIPDPEVLVRRLKQRAHPTSQLDYERVVSGKVEYREHTKEPGADWALPERLVLIKPEGFAWQDEFRIAVGKRNTMSVENVGLTIQTGPVDSVFQQVPAPIFLRVGKLTDIVTLHRF
ncbi:hypothetical protein ATDW_28820 [Asticcacaulis sp. DW145]|uniref:Uncharacterized protein n=1 Tax=Asticcacaulis currens TaxID=2984210 RepID=A0ABT5IGU0_9CAUL|nr:hypothetical protein [Asticcacaulis currens]MDC7695401.1 hypothetical protein [Asticcacaulis currens]BEV12386.1 hypothetical protein ATDW_28820 [Asticcacaulis sp. DW145]